MRASNYRDQLREKQKVKRIYGVWRSSLDVLQEGGPYEGHDW